MNRIAHTLAPSLDPLHRARRDEDKASSRLASGKRLNSAADGAAELAVAQLLRAENASYGQRVRNANDGISALQVADGALGQVNESLVRMAELAEQAAGGLLSEAQKQIVADEFNALAEGVEDIVETTQFNGHALLDGAAAGPSVSTGPAGLSVDPRMDMTALKGMTFDNPQDALHAVRSAMEQITAARAEVGSLSNGLDRTVQSLQVASENLLAAESRIADADVATEMAALTSAQMRTQMAIAMEAQGYTTSQSVLSLLG